MDLEEIYRAGLAASHVAGLQAVYDAGVAAGLVTVRKAPPIEDKTPEGDASVSALADAPVHPWNAFVKRLEG